MRALENTVNAFGEKVSAENKGRIVKYLKNPTTDNWSDITSIIIDENFTTVWGALLKIKPSYSKVQGRVTDIEGNIIRDWEEVPKPLEVLRAIKENKL